jgi:HSP20 family protein
MDRHLAIVRFTPRALTARGAETPPAECVTPLADILETPEAYIVQLDMPGASKEGIRVTISGDILSVEAVADSMIPHSSRLLYGEIGRKAYQRSFALGDGIEDAGTDAQFEDGVLTITLPKTSDVRRRTVIVR